VVPKPFVNNIQKQIIAYIFGKTWHEKKINDSMTQGKKMLDDDMAFSFM
jgi:hypothetical protein